MAAAAHPLVGLGGVWVGRGRAIAVHPVAVAVIAVPRGVRGAGIHRVQAVVAVAIADAEAIAVRVQLVCCQRAITVAVPPVADLFRPRVDPGHGVVAVAIAREPPISIGVDLEGQQGAVAVVVDAVAHLGQTGRRLALGVVTLFAGAEPVAIHVVFVDDQAIAVVV